MLQVFKQSYKAMLQNILKNGFVDAFKANPIFAEA